MKKTTTLLIVLTIALTSCIHQPKASAPAKKPDTSRVEGFYRLNKAARLDSCFRIIKDTFKLSGIDTSAAQADMTWAKDTMYYIPVISDTAKKIVSWYGVRPVFVTEIHSKPLN